jgi:hypothetical protein
MACSELMFANTPRRGVRGWAARETSGPCGNPEHRDAAGGDAENAGGLDTGAQDRQLAFRRILLGPSPGTIDFDAQSTFGQR